MIVYRKSWMGLHLLIRCVVRFTAATAASAYAPYYVPLPDLACRFYGSAVVRTFIMGFIAALQTGILYACADGALQAMFVSTQVAIYTVITTILALLLIFRQNSSYVRFIEGERRLVRPLLCELAALPPALPWRQAAWWSMPCMQVGLSCNP